MNIFEILTSGDNGLNEVHVSSVLGWLLDPYHDHGLGLEVLKRLVSNLFKDTPLDNEILGSEYSGVEMRDRRRIDVKIMLEKEVYCKETNKNRSIDVFIKINNKFILAIENKIKVSSKEHGQVLDEIKGLVDESLDADLNSYYDPFNCFDIKDFYFIYLVKQDNELGYAAKELENKFQNVCIKPISWTNSNKNELSMSKILNEIINDAAQGMINPVPLETIFLLKSFIRFAENGFSYYLGSDDQEPDRCSFNDLSNINQSYFVGFQGGIKALENNLNEAKTNTDEKERLLFKRPYKIVRNQPNDNWIRINDFLNIFKKYGF